MTNAVGVDRVLGRRFVLQYIRKFVSPPVDEWLASEGMQQKKKNSEKFYAKVLKCLSNGLQWMWMRDGIKVFLLAGTKCYRNAAEYLGSVNCKPLRFKEEEEEKKKVAQVWDSSVALFLILFPLFCTAGHVCNDKLKLLLAALSQKNPDILTRTQFYTVLLLQKSNDWSLQSNPIHFLNTISSVINYWILWVEKLLIMSKQPRHSWQGPHELIYKAMLLFNDAVAPSIRHFSRLIKIFFIEGHSLIMWPRTLKLASV